MHAEHVLDDRSGRRVGALLLSYRVPDDPADAVHVVCCDIIQALGRLLLVRDKVRRARAAHALSFGVEDGEDAGRRGQRLVDPPYQVLEPVQRLRERVSRLPLLGLLDLRRGRVRQLGVSRDVVSIDQLGTRTVFNPKIIEGEIL